MSNDETTQSPSNSEEQETEHVSNELMLHRADYAACREAGFESPGELLAAHKVLKARFRVLKRKLRKVMELL